MKTIEELRKGFEETELFKLRSNLGEISYKSHKGGYRLLGSVDIYLNGAWLMYQELNNE